MGYARKIKKKCSVRGCKNVESFAIAKTKSELGNVIICASCLAEALSSVDECRVEYDKKQAKKLEGPAPLFYHPEVKDNKEAPVDEAVDEAENEVDGMEATEENSDIDEAEATEARGFICPECGKVFASEKSLKAHISRAHKE